jgi:hypothetical protein
MNATICHIEFLVSAHNCVVIPGLGAILAHRQSAQISADASTIIPPKRVYTFNGSLTQTDGLVERSIARSLNISYERAAAIVAADVDTMRHQLANDNCLSLGRVGTLERDAEGNTQFKTFDSDALTPAANWLQTVSVSKIKVSGENQAEALRHGRRRLSPVARFVRVAAAAVVLAIIAFASSTPITIQDANYAAIALPEVKAPAREFVPSTTTPILEIRHDASVVNTPVDTAARYAYQRQQRLGIAPTTTQANAAESEATPAVTEQKAPTAAKAAPTAAPVAEQTAQAIRINDNDAFCVIVASVGNTAEAETYIADAKRKYNETCALLHNDGRYRIYAATAPTSAAAKAIAQSLAKRHPGAWVCAR